MNLNFYDATGDVWLIKMPKNSVFNIKKAQIVAIEALYIR